ncbi:MAG: dihydroorotase [Calditrichaceae bacterium]
MSDISKTIRNVLIAGEDDNSLELVEIHFNDQIQRIKRLLPGSIGWEEISSRNRWLEWQKKYQTGRRSAGNSDVIEGDFHLLIPGAIDSHVHFNTPGFEDREDFEHGSSAAASGGVTTVIDMPCTSIPPVTSLKNMEIKLNALKGRSLVDYAFWGGVSGNDLDGGVNVKKNIIELASAGVVGFKAYLISGMESFRDLNMEQMELVAEWIKPTMLPLAVHAEAKELVLEQQEHFQKIGKKDWCAYYCSRDERAEALAVARMIQIARKTRCQVHIVHLSSEFGVEMIQNARKESVPVTAETCPHYLYFTRDDFDNSEISSYLKTAPPVKTDFDRSALWKGLEDDTIFFVTTDHAGCDPDKEKSSDNFWEVYGGIPGVEHRIPFLFSEGFKKGRINLKKTIDLLSTNPAKYFGIDGKKGSLNIGKDADFALINLWDQKQISAGGMHSKGKYTPFEGVVFEAIVEKTFLRGAMIASREGDMFTKPGYGTFIRAGK